MGFRAFFFAFFSLGQTLTHELRPEAPNATRWVFEFADRRPLNTSFRQLATISTEWPPTGAARFVYEWSCVLRAESSELKGLGRGESFLVH